MDFWQLAYEMKWVTAEELRRAVICENNKFGEITEIEYHQITGENYAGA